MSQSLHGRKSVVLGTGTAPTTAPPKPKRTTMPTDDLPTADETFATFPEYMRSEIAGYIETHPPDPDLVLTPEDTTEAIEVASTAASLIVLGIRLASAGDDTDELVEAVWDLTDDSELLKGTLALVASMAGQLIHSYASKS